MTLGILEINDAGIRFGQGETIAIESPGVATLVNDELLLGNDALTQSKIMPTQSVNHFWHKLSVEPLPFQHKHYQHHADLAFAQLTAVQKKLPDCDKVILALPGSFTRDQLALLLGIVEQCTFSATGLIDSALAASSFFLDNKPEFATPKKLIHIDLQLHQAIFTTLSITPNNELQREQVDILPGLGLIGLKDQWARALAEHFIEQTRFDPLHSATTEQALYDQLPAWMQQAQQLTDIIFEIGGRAIKLSHQQVTAPLRVAYEQITELAMDLANIQSSILISSHINQFPGLNNQIQQAAATKGNLFGILPVNATQQGVSAYLKQIERPSNNLQFIQKLQLSNIANTDTEQPANRPSHSDRVIKNQKDMATHFLLEGIAYPIANWSVVATRFNLSGAPKISLVENNWQIIDTESNTAKNIQTNNTLRLGNTAIHFIRVQDN